MNFNQANDSVELLAEFSAFGKHSAHLAKFACQVRLAPEVRLDGRTLSVCATVRVCMKASQE